MEEYQKEVIKEHRAQAHFIHNFIIGLARVSDAKRNKRKDTKATAIGQKNITGLRL